MSSVESVLHQPEKLNGCTAVTKAGEHLQPPSGGDGEHGQVVRGKDDANGRRSGDTAVNEGASDSAARRAGSRAATNSGPGDDTLDIPGRGLTRRDVEGGHDRSPSPHCHFAPLPLASTGSSISRRSSISTGTATRSKLLGHDEASTLEIDGTHRGVLSTTTTNASTPRPTTPLPGTAIITPTPFRSPSRSASISRPPSAQSSHIIPPPLLSRKLSTDAVSHHYIEARRNGSSRERRGVDVDSASSREREGVSGGAADRENHEKEVLGFDAMRTRESAAWREQKNTVHQFLSTSHPSSPSAPSPPTMSTLLGDTAPHTSIPTAVPLLHTSIITAVSASTLNSTRRTLFSEPSAAELERTLVAGRCRPVTTTVLKPCERDVMAVGPSLADSVDEDPDDESEGNGEEEEEEDEDAEEGEEEDNTKQLDAEGDAALDEEEEEEEPVVRATAKGAGVEVVHWHVESDGGPLEEKEEDLDTIAE